MRIKQQPEDFVVEELASLAPVPDGAYHVYRLTKRECSTLEALERIAAEHDRSPRAFVIAGLQEKYAETTQYVSVREPLAAPLAGQGWSLAFVGRTRDAVGPEQLTGHRYALVVRDLSTPEYEALPRKMGELSQGIVNYFDSQRFGTGRVQNEFIAKPLIAGDARRAVKLFLTGTSGKDHTDVKRRKREIAERWGDWHSLASKLPRCPERPVIRHLMATPKDFLGAFMQIDRQRRAQYLFAFQSAVWNQTAARMLADAHAAHLLADYRLGELAFHITLPPERLARWRGLSLPLVTHTTEIADREARTALDAALDAEGLALAQFRVRGAPTLFFKEVDRPLLLFPDELDWEPRGDDPLNPGRFHGRLRLTVAPGSYATLLLKRLFQCRRGPDHPDQSSPEQPPAATSDLADWLDTPNDEPPQPPAL